MNTTFSPIRSDIPDTRKSTGIGLSGNVWLDLCAAQDECADYAQALPVHIKPTDDDALVTREEIREVTLPALKNSDDTWNALEFIYQRNEFPEVPEAFWNRLEELELEFAEKRLNREGGL